MRRFLFWLGIIGFAVLTLAFGALTALLFFTFGSGDSIRVQGLEIKDDQIANCSSLLIDFESVTFNDVPSVFELAGLREFIQIATTEGTELVGVVASRSVIDNALLGRRTCGLTTNQGSEVIEVIEVTEISSGEEELTADVIESVAFEDSGKLLEIPIDVLSDKSLLVTGDFEAGSTLLIQGAIYYAKASIALLVSGILTVLFLIVECALIAFGIIRRKRSPQEVSA